MTAHSSLTLGQRRRLDKGTMVPAFRHTDRAPSEPFPFASHRPLSEAWSLTADEASTARDEAMLARNAG
jgi:hypothetical protein